MVRIPMPRPRLARAAAPAALLLLLACATPPRVEVDRPAGEDLSGFETFAVREDGSTSDDPAYGPSARAAARSALVAELRARGLERVDDAEAADLLVSVGVFSESRLEGGDVYVTPGTTGMHRHTTGVRTPVGDVPLSESHHPVHHPPHVTTTPATEVISRTVVVDVFEARSQRLLWRGTSRDARTSRRQIDLDDLRERVRAIASEFP